MNDITPKEANEILSHYTDLGYGIVIEGDDTSKIKQALSLASKTLENGTPYNPSGDLISREALKGVIETYRPALIYNNKTDMKNKMVDYFLDEIDNAPTVDIKDQIAGAYNEGYMCGSREAEKARPKGEWIKEPNGKTTDIYRCSICGRSILLCKNADLSKYPFCHCGADMRPKGGKE